MKDKFNKVRTFSLKVNTFNDDKAVINLDDITELEEALLKAHISEHSKSMFVANMSHEIRTPLNGILGFTDILLKSNLEEKDKRYLQIIHKSGETLLGIVNDILDMAKIENGQMELDIHDVNLSTEIESVVSIFAAKAKEKRIEYHIFIDPNLPTTIKCDAQRIKQVLSNLINNAIKFTKENGEIHVDIIIKDRKDNQILLYIGVKDNGIGIKEDKISSIFQTFTQADNSISRQYGGTGLGLPISSKFIELMDGKIKVKSKENKGSLFYFEIWLDIIDDSKFLDLHSKFSNLKVCIYKPQESTIYKTLKSYLRVSLFLKHNHTVCS